MTTSSAENESNDIKPVTNEDPVVVALCDEALEPARSVVASLSGTLTENIRVPVGRINETSPNASEEKTAKMIDVIATIASQSIIGMV